jgi:hypothetical protein
VEIGASAPSPALPSFPESLNTRVFGPLVQGSEFGRAGRKGMSRNNRGQGGPPRPPRDQPSETHPAPAPSPPPASDRNALYALAGVIGGSMFAFIGSQWVAKSAFDAQMVQIGCQSASKFCTPKHKIGVGILSADPSKSDVAPAREWAIKLVETHSGQNFSDQDRGSLSHHPIQTAQTLPPIPGFVFSGIPCSALQRNPDGSWTVATRKSAL